MSQETTGQDIDDAKAAAGRFAVAKTASTLTPKYHTPSKLIWAARASRLKLQLGTFVLQRRRHGLLQDAAKESPSPAPSIISSAVKITGSLKFSSNAVINGQIEGEVRGGNVFVGEEACVHGEIIAQSVTVNGQVHGDILAHEIVLGPKCRLEGSTVQNALTIATGACFTGTCRTVDAVNPSDIVAFKTNITQAQHQDAVAQGPDHTDYEPDDRLPKIPSEFWQSPADLKFQKAWAALCRSPEIAKIKDGIGK